MANSEVFTSFFVTPFVVLFTRTCSLGKRAMASVRVGSEYSIFPVTNVVIFSSLSE